MELLPLQIASSMSDKGRPVLFLFSVDTLIDMLTRAWVQVKSVVTPRKRKL
jgi:hypothetical protein